MKSLKRISCLVLALLLLLGLGTSALAANIDLSKNAITVTGVTAGTSYQLYKMLDLDVSEDMDAYSYTVNNAWSDFFSTGAGKDYVTIDAQGYVTWKDGMGDADDMIAFGKAAAAYAESQNLTPLQTITAGGFEAGVMFGNLDSGYYLITSTLGTRTIVVTTPANPKVTVTEKNGAPSVTKQVQEDSKVSQSDNGWGKTNDADIGQTVNFKATITAQPGALNYVFHDTMSSGLTLNTNSIEVSVGSTKLNNSYYTINLNPTSDDCTFEISFEKTYLDSIKAQTTIVVTYSATLNKDAVIAGKGNPNECYLSYGDKGNGQGSYETPHDKTVTYTWNVNVLKYGNGNENKVLKDAQFVLLNSNKTQVAVFQDGKITEWKSITANMSWPDGAVLTTGADGKIVMSGLDADTYYLREIKAPSGYNKLSDDQKVEITPTTDAQENTMTYTPVEVKINNNTGTELPTTGGMGTTIFYVVGGVIVLAAAVLLITKKRMSAG